MSSGRLPLYETPPSDSEIRGEREEMLVTQSVDTTSTVNRDKDKFRVNLGRETGESGRRCQGKGRSRAVVSPLEVSRKLRMIGGARKQPVLRAEGGGGGDSWDKTRTPLVGL